MSDIGDLIEEDVLSSGGEDDDAIFHEVDFSGSPPFFPASPLVRCRSLLPL